MMAVGECGGKSGACERCCEEHAGLPRRALLFSGTRRGRWYLMARFEASSTRVEGAHVCGVDPVS